MDVIRKLISLGAMKKATFEREVGLQFKYIMSKLGDGTLDHIHLRKVNRYLASVADGELDSMVTGGTHALPPRYGSVAPMGGGAVNAIPLDAIPLDAIPLDAIPLDESGGFADPNVGCSKRRKRYAQCPVLAMGYAGVQCPSSDTGGVLCSKMVEHLATHVATLMKHTMELEAKVDALSARLDGKGTLVSL